MEAGDAYRTSGFSQLRSDDPRHVARTLFRWSQQMVGIDGAILYLLDGGRLVTLAAHEVSERAMNQLSALGDQHASPIETALDVGAPHAVTDARVLAALDWRTGLAVPMSLDGRSTGVYLAGWRSAFPILEDTVAVLEAAASMAALAIDRAQLLEGVKREEQRLRMLIDLLPIPAVRVSQTTLLITWLNEEARRLVGDIRDLRITELLGQAEAYTGGAGLTPDAVQRSRDLPLPARLAFTAADGTRRVVLPRLARIGTDDLVITLMDVTPEASLEAQRQRFVRMISHHLRTPLTPIYGYAEMLTQPDAELPITEAARAIVGSIDELTEHIARLEQIANLQPVDPGALESCDVVALLARAWPIDQPRSSLAFTPAGRRAEALCVPSYVTSALTELFDNAFTHGRPPVTVVVDTTAEHVIVDIHDEGKGIPEEWVTSVFAPYLGLAEGYLAPPGGRLGLGLPLARALMEATLGDLSYTDGRFEIRLLRDPSSPPPPAD